MRPVRQSIDRLVAKAEMEFAHYGASSFVYLRLMVCLECKDLPTARFEGQLILSSSYLDECILDTIW
jgi:hypothetical protein